MARPLACAVLALLVFGHASAEAAARAPSAQGRALGRGRALAQAHCSPCHAIGAGGESANPQAPPFRTLHRIQPVADVIAALAEGAKPRHPAMPRFRMSFAQSRDLIAYVQSIQD